MLESTLAPRFLSLGAWRFSWRRSVVLMLVGMGLAKAQSQEVPAVAPAADCRVAFDMGSSGVRVLASGVPERLGLPSRDLDVLTPLMQGQGMAQVLPEVERALRDLPLQAQLPNTCRLIGGGFSAWRLAWRQEGPALVSQLAALREQTGVAVLIIPAAVEGRYGHNSAIKTLGPRLQTSHIFDLGGGSLQVAGHDRSFGIELGQKSWLYQLCRVLGRVEGAVCPLLPLTATELQQARDVLTPQLQTLTAEVGGGTLTAISRPVTRGIRSALRALDMAQTDTITLSDLSRAIERLSPLPLDELMRLTQLSINFAPYLVSDMLLVEGVLRSMKLSSLALAETSINNLPALLSDEQAFAWAQQHPCYLQRLREQGPSAYFSDPLNCPKAAQP